MVSNASPQPESSATPRDATVIPLAQERVVLDKREVPTGAVRIVVKVHEESQQVEVPTQRETCTVQHVPVNRRVDQSPGIRQEGDVTIIPVLEEVVVVEKHLILREEIHITRQRSVEPHQQYVMLRREEAHIEHVDLRQPETHDPQQTPEPGTGSGEQR